MKNLAGVRGERRTRRQAFADALGGKTSNGNHPLRPQRFERFSQVSIARSEQGFLFGRPQFIRRAISARALEKRQWTVIEDEMTLKKFCRTAEPFCEQTP